MVAHRRARVDHARDQLARRTRRHVVAQLVHTRGRPLHVGLRQPRAAEADGAEGRVGGVGAREAQQVRPRAAVLCACVQQHVGLPRRRLDRHVEEALRPVIRLCTERGVNRGSCPNGEGFAVAPAASSRTATAASSATEEMLAHACAASWHVSAWRICVTTRTCEEKKV